jgi:hypothetical protein
MTPLEVVREIVADCERDAMKLDGRLFDARNVAEVFGETLAMVQALAKVVETLLPEGEPVTFEVGDKVKILVGDPDENLGRIATVGRVQEDDGVVIYFGDQDEEEWVYGPNSLEKIV